ncbi:MAG: hypothetical protein M3295_09185 [Chloroflexota bacterium]|nr:hypothetical protein [Chloroflexota bacterium]
MITGEELRLSHGPVLDADACALEEPPGSALGMALHAISLLTRRRLIDDIERHRDDAQLIVLPPPAR